MIDEELKDYIRKTVKKEFKNLLPEYVIQKEIFQEQTSFTSLSEFLVKLGVLGDKNSKGLEATKFALELYINHSLQPCNEFYDKLKEAGFYERLLAWSKDIAKNEKTPLYRIVFAMYEGTNKHLTNTQFVIIAGNYYMAKMAEKNK